MLAIIIKYYIIQLYNPTNESLQNLNPTSVFIKK